MARPKLRRSPQLECLEKREVMSSGLMPGGEPTAQAQYMMERINEVRTHPGQGADHLLKDLTPDVLSTLNFYGVSAQSVHDQIAASQPKPALSWNTQLAQAAQAHSQDMAINGFQSHNGSDGSDPNARMTRAGYTNRLKGAENAFAYAKSEVNAIDAFLYDWGVEDKGHRRNIMEPDSNSDNAMKEIGIGIADSSRLGLRSRR